LLTVLNMTTEMPESPRSEDSLRLKIVVCIKQVPLLSALHFDTETRRLVREGVPLELNELDVYALAEALRLRDLHAGEVIAITMGPPQAREALAHAIAIGADRAIHLNDRAFAGADTFATARALALTIERERPDIIFCGRHSIDAETSQVGPEIAEMLRMPQISAVLSVEVHVEDGKREIRASRELDEGSETLVVPLPALLTAAEKLNEGIWPDEQAIHKAAAQTERYTELRAADLSDDLAIFGQQASPTWVATIENDPHQRAGRVLSDDDPAQLVDLLLDDLEARGLLSPDAPENAQSNMLSPQPLRSGDALPGRTVLVIAEHGPEGVRGVTLELLGKGIELAAALQGELAALLIGGPDIERYAPTLAARGAEKVYIAADSALEHYSTDGYTAIASSAIRSIHPAAVLLGSTANGRDLAPRVAARLHLGLTGDCIDLAIDEQQRLVQYKPAFGNQIISLILSNTQPAMATIRPGMLRAAQPDFTRRAANEYLPTEGIAEQIHSLIITQEYRETGVEALESARTVIGVGMGVGQPEQYAEVRRLAGLLHAAIGTSRNVADQSWLPKQAQIGLTGRAIAPRLYIALGIRGAAEHVSGIRKTGYVVSINKNRRAAIFRHSDVGVVGDVHVLLPLINERLARRL
jgi:electron transfer flavoprotein alpha subunit